MKKRGAWLRWILLCPGLLFGGENAKRLERGVSILDHWNKDQHLYVVGDLRIRESRLSGLEKWLDANGPNWTILLMESSRGETYTDAEGKSHRGLDAVEFAMGQGLPARTEFGELMDARTKEANGAYFILFLKDRKFSYFGMPHYEARGLGSRNWAGNLDRAALKAMRNGGRIVDAAKGTVSLVDGRIENYFAGLKAVEEKKKRGEMRMRMKAMAAIAGARRELEQVKTRREKLRQERWFLEGDVFELEVEEIEGVIKEAEDVLKGAPAGVSLVEEKVRDVRSRLSRWQMGVRRFLSDEEMLSILAREISSANFESPEAQKSLESARQKMDLSLGYHEEGSPEYLQAFESASRMLRAAFKEEQDFHQYRRMVYVGSAVGIGFIGVLGIWGNRSRRRVKEEAETLVVSRKKEMTEIVNRLFHLMDRASVVVGPVDELEKRGYEGETLELSRKALGRIDEAFVLSSHVQRIVEEAESLVFGKNPWSWSRNLISGGLYARAVDLLDDEVVCHPEEGAVLKDEAKGEERERVAAAEEEYAIPIDAWKAKTEGALDEAKECLDVVDDAWSTIVSRCEELRKGIDGLEKMEAKFLESEDGFLGCGVLFSAWVDAMESAHNEGVSVGTGDPVFALREPVLDGDRMVREAGQLLDGIVVFREEQWDAMMQGKEALKGRRRSVIWINEALAGFSDEADELAEIGVEGTVVDWVEGLLSRLSEFSENVEIGVELAKRADEESQPSIVETEATVEKVRRELAQALSLPGKSVLHEKGNHPGLNLERSRTLLAEGLAFLDSGKVEEAGDSLARLDDEVKRASHLVKDSQEVFENFEPWFDELNEHRNSLNDSSELMRKSVEEMRQRYAPRSLFVDPREDEEGGYAEAPLKVDELLKKIARGLELSKERFEVGHLLDARRLIGEGRILRKDGVDLCAEVAERKELLAQLEEGNERSLSKYEIELVDLKPSIADRRVMRITKCLFQETSELLQESRKEVKAGDGLRNPFLAEDVLSKLGGRISDVREGISSDLKHYEAVKKHFAQVSLAQEEALNLSYQAQNDRIADSEETTKSLREIESQGRRLREAEVTLNGEHEDWEALGHSLRGIHLAISEAMVSLRKELRQAREALAVLQSAAAEVRRAENWSGSHGVRIGMFSGDDYLITANQAMMKGLYAQAIQSSGQARSSARSAVAAAESRVASRRRAEREAKRRKRRAASRSRMRSSSFGSSSRSSFSSSSRRSSTGRSSFSSGSGVGRSGW